MQGKISWGRRFLAFLAIIGVSVAAFWLPFVFLPSEEPPPSAFVFQPPMDEVRNGLLVLGVAVLAIGLLAYVITFRSNCFTARYDKPIWPTLRVRLFLANIVVPLLMQSGVATIVGGLLAPVLDARGVDRKLAFLAPLFGTFLLLQILFVWLTIWGPLGARAARRRLASMGCTDEEIARASPIGISDPAKKSSKKMCCVEDDIGLLWITPHELTYRGDSDEFRISRADFIALERKADAGSVSAYFGNQNIILRFRTESGAERTVRLHPESDWTMTGAARSSDLLAAAIHAWAASPPVESPATIDEVLEV